MKASVRELAKAAGVSYAAAHSELMAMEAHGLAVSRGEGSRIIFQANQSYPQADVLRQLVSSADAVSPMAPTPTTDTVLANLQRYGAPLQADIQVPAEWTLEETLAQALVLSHESATVLRTLVLVVTMHVAILDFDTLRVRATALRERRSLGFVLDVAATLSGNVELKDFAESLRDRRVKRDTHYFSTVRGKFAQELARRHTPDVAKEWHFVLDMPLGSFRSLYEKFVEPT